MPTVPAPMAASVLDAEGITYEYLDGQSSQKQRQARKKALASNIVSTDESIFKQLTAEDIADMFS